MPVVDIEKTISTDISGGLSKSEARLKLFDLSSKAKSDTCNSSEYDPIFFQ